MSPYSAPGIKQEKDEFDGVFNKSSEDMVRYLVNKVKEINGIDVIDTNNRTPRHKDCRWWHIYLSIRLMGYTTSVAARLYGKDHSTACHVMKNMDNSMIWDKQFIRKYAKIIQEYNDYRSEQKGRERKV